MARISCSKERWTPQTESLFPENPTLIEIEELIHPSLSLRCLDSRPSGLQKEEIHNPMDLQLTQELTSVELIALERLKGSRHDIPAEDRGGGQ